MHHFRLAPIAVLSGLLLCAPSAQSGKFNAKISIGDPAPVFADLPGTDGKKYGLSDFKEKDAVVVVVTCNHCPTSVDYEDRLVAFAKKYAGEKNKVGLIAISVSDHEDDTLELMKEKAKEKGFTFPYVRDESQAIGRALGATVTPEFFLLDKNRKIVFTGAMDDNDDPAKVKVKYLEDALESLLAGKQIAVPEARPVGCSIVYKKSGKDKKETVPLKETKPALPGEVKLHVVKYPELGKAIRGFRGKVVVADIWANWCVPCKHEFPHLVELHNEFAASGLLCVSVSLDDEKDHAKALKFLQQRNATFPNYRLDEEKRFAFDKFDLKAGIPAVFVFDRDGLRAGKFSAEKEFTYANDVKPLVQKLLKEKK